MSLVRRAARPLYAAARPRPDAAGEQRPAVPAERPTAWTRAAPWLILGCYLLGAIALTWHLWADPAGSAQIVPGVGVSHDIDLFSWFLRYEATAIGHGRLPALVTTALNAPEGINLMWNTSFLLPGVVFAPLTLVAGPQVSLSVLLVLGFAGSAATMFWVLRRWGASLAAAALGGALFGFSPALRVAAVGHPHLQFAVLLPLIFDALLRLLTGRGRPVRTGAWLGLLMAAQLFIAEETVALTVVTAVLIVVVLAASRPRAVLGRIRGAVTGLAAAAVVVVVTAGYPLWVQFHGPLAEQGSPWKLGQYHNHLGDFVDGPSGFLLHSNFTVHNLAHHAGRMVEYFAYLGWPMLVVLALAAVCFWRDVRIRALAVTFAVLEVLSLGSRTLVVRSLHIPARAMPWHYLQGLPLLSQSLPNRFSLLADGAAAVILAFSLDLAWGRVAGRAVPAAGAPSAGAQSAGAPSAGAPSAGAPSAGAPDAAPAADGPPVPPRAPAWRKAAAVVLIALAVVPIIPLPLQTAPVDPTPAGWQQTFARLRLPSDARVLVLPLHIATVMRWQADTGVPGSLIGGYCIAPNARGKAKICRTGRTDTAHYLDDLWMNQPGVVPPSTARVRADVAYMRPAAMVAVTTRDSRLGRYLRLVFGPPAFQDRAMLVWRPVKRPQAIPNGSRSTLKG